MLDKITSANVWFEGARNKKQNDKYNGPIEFYTGGYVHLKRRGVVLPPHRIIEIKDKEVTEKES